VKVGKPQTFDANEKERMNIAFEETEKRNFERKQY